MVKQVFSEVTRSWAELYPYIHDFLVTSGLTKTAASLLKEAKTKVPLME